MYVTASIYVSLQVLCWYHGHPEPQLLGDCPQNGHTKVNTYFYYINFVFTLPIILSFKVQLRMFLLLCQKSISSTMRLTLLLI